MGFLRSILARWRRPVFPGFEGCTDKTIYNDARGTAGSGPMARSSPTSPTASPAAGLAARSSASSCPTATTKLTSAGICSECGEPCRTGASAPAVVVSVQHWGRLPIQERLPIRERINPPMARTIHRIRHIRTQTLTSMSVEIPGDAFSADKTHDIQVLRRGAANEARLRLPGTTTFTTARTHGMPLCVPTRETLRARTPRNMPTKSWRCSKK